MIGDCRSAAWATCSAPFSTDVIEVLAKGAWWLFFGPLAALAGYGYKQWYGYRTTKTAYG